MQPTNNPSKDAPRPAVFSYTSSLPTASSKYSSLPILHSHSVDPNPHSASLPLPAHAKRSAPVNTPIYPRFLPLSQVSQSLPQHARKAEYLTDQTTALRRMPRARGYGNNEKQIAGLATDAPLELYVNDVNNQRGWLDGQPTLHHAYIDNVNANNLQKLIDKEMKSLSAHGSRVLGSESEHQRVLDMTEHSLHRNLTDPAPSRPSATDPDNKRLEDVHLYVQRPDHNWTHTTLSTTTNIYEEPLLARAHQLPLVAENAPLGQHPRLSSYFANDEYAANAIDPIAFNNMQKETSKERFFRQTGLSVAPKNQQSSSQHQPSSSTSSTSAPSTYLSNTPAILAGLPSDAKLLIQRLAHAIHQQLQSNHQQSSNTSEHHSPSLSTSQPSTPASVVLTHDPQFGTSYRAPLSFLDSMQSIPKEDDIVKVLFALILSRRGVNPCQALISFATELGLDRAAGPGLPVSVSTTTTTSNDTSVPNPPSIDPSSHPLKTTSTTTSAQNDINVGSSNLSVRSTVQLASSLYAKASRQFSCGTSTNPYDNNITPKDSDESTTGCDFAQQQSSPFPSLPGMTGPPPEYLAWLSNPDDSDDDDDDDDDDDATKATFIQPSQHGGSQVEPTSLPISRQLPLKNWATSIQTSQHPWSLFHSGLDTVIYTDVEYRTLLGDPAWTKTQTDRLLSLYCLYNGDFTIIRDRFVAQERFDELSSDLATVYDDSSTVERFQSAVEHARAEDAEIKKRSAPTLTTTTTTTTTEPHVENNDDDASSTQHTTKRPRQDPLAENNAADDEDKRYTDLLPSSNPNAPKHALVQPTAKFRHIVSNVVDFPIDTELLEAIRDVKGDDDFVPGNISLSYHQPSTQWPLNQAQRLQQREAEVSGLLPPPTAQLATLDPAHSGNNESSKELRENATVPKEIQNFLAHHDAKTSISLINEQTASHPLYMQSLLSITTEPVIPAALYPKYLPLQHVTPFHAPTFLANNTAGNNENTISSTLTGSAGNRLSANTALPPGIPFEVALTDPAMALLAVTSHTSQESQDNTHVPYPQAGAPADVIYRKFASLPHVPVRVAMVSFPDALIEQQIHAPTVSYFAAPLMGIGSYLRTDRQLISASQKSIEDLQARFFFTQAALLRHRHGVGSMFADVPRISQYSTYNVDYDKYRRHELAKIYGRTNHLMALVCRAVGDYNMLNMWWNVAKNRVLIYIDQLQEDIYKNLDSTAAVAASLGMGGSSALATSASLAASQRARVRYPVAQSATTAQRVSTGPAGFNNPGPVAPVPVASALHPVADPARQFAGNPAINSVAPPVAAVAPLSTTTTLPPATSAIAANANLQIAAVATGSSILFVNPHPASSALATQPTPPELLAKILPPATLNSPLLGKPILPLIDEMKRVSNHVSVPIYPPTLKNPSHLLLSLRSLCPVSFTALVNPDMDPDLTILIKQTKSIDPNYVSYYDFSKDLLQTWVGPNGTVLFANGVASYLYEGMDITKSLPLPKYISGSLQTPTPTSLAHNYYTSFDTHEIVTALDALYTQLQRLHELERVFLKRVLSPAYSSIASKLASNPTLTSTYLLVFDNLQRRVATAPSGPAGTAQGF